MSVERKRAHKRCVDCESEGITSKRSAYVVRGKPVPGGRCRTHHLAKRKRDSEVTAEKRWAEKYGISADDYWAVYKAQNELCFICQRANGSVRRLAVDHDHKTGYVRGLLCKACNRGTLGHARDDVEFFSRCIEYLTTPPAFAVIGKRVVPNHLGENK